MHSNGAQMFLSFSGGFGTKLNYCAIIIKPKCIMDDSMRSQIRGQLPRCSITYSNCIVHTHVTAVVQPKSFLKIVTFLLVPIFLWPSRREIMARAMAFLVAQDMEHPLSCLAASYLTTLWNKAKIEYMFIVTQVNQF